MLVSITRKLDSREILISYEGINYVEPICRGGICWTKIVMKGGKSFEIMESVEELNNRVKKNEYNI